MRKKCLILVAIAVSGTSSCTKKVAFAEKKEPQTACNPAYGEVIKPLILLKCATANCHVANFPFGNFTTYGDLKARIDNGRIKTLVFEQQLMPPSGAARLTSEEIDQLKCWIDHGAQEN